MSIPSFESQREAWSNPPVDDVGYISSESLMKLDDDELLEMIQTMEVTRYQGWRNQNNRWRELLGLDSTHGKDVLDYGCGVGLEALQYARSGNHVTVADIVYENTCLAGRVQDLHGYSVWMQVLAEHTPRAPFYPRMFDVIHCAGVLHHIPYATSVVEEMASWLRSTGELRLLLYSDVAWERATGTSAPEDTLAHPRYEVFVQEMDGVGTYAEWYDRSKIIDLCGQWFTLERCEYVGNLHFVGAVLRKR